MPAPRAHSRHPQTTGRQRSGGQHNKAVLFGLLFALAVGGGWLLLQNQVRERMRACTTPRLHARLHVLLPPR